MEVDSEIVSLSRQRECRVSYLQVRSTLSAGSLLGLAAVVECKLHSTIAFHDLNMGLTVVMCQTWHCYGRRAYDGTNSWVCPRSLCFGVFVCH
jgi:hypothetical protein